MLYSAQQHRSYSQMGAALCPHPYFWRNTDELIFFLRNFAGRFRDYFRGADAVLGLSDDAADEAAAAAERDGVHRGGHSAGAVLPASRARQRD